LAVKKCGVCDRPHEGDEEKCGNPICNWDNRYFLRNYAVAMKTKYGDLEEAIKSYKFRNNKYWAIIFARVLAGFLQDERDVFEHFDLIVSSPTYVGPDGRDWDHTRLVLETAHIESRGEWPFDIGYERPAIVKTGPTTPMTNKTWHQRHEIATNEIRNVLEIPDPARTNGKTILVYDDVFTDGHTLNEAALCLKIQGGAAEVCGVTLARQIFRMPTLP
jgi:predicted amidophosphoribosyltransferase